MVSQQPLSLEGSLTFSLVEVMAVVSAFLIFNGVGLCLICLHWHSSQATNNIFLRHQQVQVFCKENDGSTQRANRRQKENYSTL